MPETQKDGLSSIFNSTVAVTAITIGIDILLFAWMHFTPEGMTFGAGVADFLGMTSSVAEAADLTEAVTMDGTEVFTFD